MRGQLRGRQGRQEIKSSEAGGDIAECGGAPEDRAGNLSGAGVPGEYQGAGHEDDAAGSDDMGWVDAEREPYRCCEEDPDEECG